MGSLVDNPPVQQPNRLHLSRLLEHGSVDLVSVSPKIHGENVHYYNGRTCPHRTDGECVPCKAGSRLVWYGYIHALYLGGVKPPTVFELTRQAADDVVELATSVGWDTLRGAPIRLHRSKGGRFGRLRARFFRDERYALPPEVVEHHPSHLLRMLYYVQPRLNFDVASLP